MAAVAAASTSGTALLAGNLTVATRLKQAFEIAARHAERRPQRRIDRACLLLGIVEVEDALANRLLYDNGVDPTTSVTTWSVPKVKIGPPTRLEDPSS